VSILSFLLKNKTEMANTKTKHVRVGKYTLTSHAQNRIVDPTRKLEKIDVLDNLFTRPHGITNIKYDEQNRPSYNRIGKRATTSINPNNHYITSVRPVSKDDRKEFNLTKIYPKRRRPINVKQNTRKKI
jgi:hypothetical protein